MLVNYRHGRLRLWCKVYTFRNNGTSISKNAGFVTIYIGLSFILGIKEKVKGWILVLEVKLHHLFAVVGLCAVRFFHGESIFKRILHVIRIIGWIGILLIQDTLDIRVLSGHDLQTAAVQKVLCLCLGVALDVHQVIDNLLGKLILEIRVNLTLGLGALFLSLADTCIDVIIQSVIILGLGDISLLQHMIQDFLTSLCIFLGVLNRIVLGRSLGDTCKGSTFRKVQVPDVLIEILSGSSLNTVCTSSQVDGIQVIFQDDIFITDLLFDFDGKILLLEFTGKTFDLGGLICPVSKYVVLQKLLGNGTCTLGKASGCQRSHTGT